MNTYAAYNNAALKAHRSAQRAAAHRGNGFYAMIARIDARAEYLAKHAYLGSCKNSNQYLSR